MMRNFCPLPKTALLTACLAVAVASTAWAQNSPAPAPTPAAATSPAPATPTATVTGGTYAVSFTTGPKWDKSKAPNLQEGFAEHSANLRRLRESGVLHAGARYGEVGLMIVRADSVDAATALFAADPTIAAGVFRIEVVPFFTVYGGELKRELNPKR